MRDATERVVEEIRDLVSADGGDILVVADADGELRIALVLPDESCRECVLPRAMLEQIAGDLATKHGATGVTVTIDDPREP